MGSKRTKKSKLELEFFSEKHNMKRDDEDDILESVTSDEAIDNGIIPSVMTKAPKRKKKSEGTEEVPKKVKKTNDETDAKRDKVKKRKKSIENMENTLNGDDEFIEDSPKSGKNDNADKKKDEITWPDQDIVELINRMETNIPEKDVLAYRSRVEKLNWNNVAFKNYPAEECKKTWLQVQKRIRRFRLLREVLNDAKEWITTPKISSKIPRPKKHPDMPRRPLSSYLLFYLKTKDEIISENPGLDGSDITKIVGQIYKNLPPEKREQYEKMAASNREEYLEKLKIFFENHPEFVPPQKLNLNQKIEKEKDNKPLKVEREKLPSPEKVPTKVEKTPKVEKEKLQKIEKEKTPKVANNKPKGKPGRPPKQDTNVDRPPKKCQTPFGLYYASELKNMEPGTDKIAFKEKCKLQYKQMSDKKKVHWINLAEQDLLRYQEEVKAYKAKFPDFKIHRVRSIITKREKASKERAAGKPVKPANSAYALYSRVMLQSEEIKSVHPKDRMNYIANKWKNCSEEEQNKYRDQVVQLMEQYKQDYQAYLDSLPEEEKRKLTPAEKKNKGVRVSINKLKKPPRRTPIKKVQPVKTKFSEPEQPPISACKYFASLYKGDGDPVQAWKALGAEEKRKYEDELVRKKQAYIVEFEKFLKSLSKEELEAFSKSRQQQAQSDDEDSSECSSDSEEDDDDEDEEGDCEQNDESHNNEDESD